MKHLFVYGTLAPGRANHHVLGAMPGSWHAATTRGRLIDEGWGAALGSPGIVLCDDGEAVNGFVVESPELERYLPMLDEFEGAQYRRVLATVRMHDGCDVEAYVYELNRGR